MNPDASYDSRAATEPLPRVHGPVGRPLLCMKEGEHGVWAYGNHGSPGALRLLSVEKLLSRNSETRSVDLYEWERDALKWPRDGTWRAEPGEYPPGMPAYVAISHTWGQSEDVKRRSKKAKRPLLIQTEPEEHYEISWLGLVQAATAAEKLKCDYLWLDLLCLNQLSKDDKKKQITNMHNIYSNATAVVVMFGGVSAAQGLDQSSSWINRAWTLQEATLCSEIWGLVDLKGPVEQFVTKMDSETGGHTLIVFERLEGDIAIVEVRDLLKYKPGEFIGKGKAVDSYGMEKRDDVDLNLPVLCFGRDASAMAALLSAMSSMRWQSEGGEGQGFADGTASKDHLKDVNPGEGYFGAVRTGSAWRSMWLRTSTKKEDMVFSTMHLLGATIKVDYSRKLQDLVFELIDKTSSTPSWLSIGYDIPVMPSSGLIPQLPTFVAQADPFYEVDGKKRAASSMVCGNFDCEYFDIEILSTDIAKGHLICARMYIVKDSTKPVKWVKDSSFDYYSDMDISNPGHRLSTGCRFRGKMGSIVVIVGRQSKGAEPFVYLLGENNKGVFQKTGAGILDEPLFDRPDDLNSMEWRHLRVGGGPNTKASLDPCTCGKVKQDVNIKWVFKNKDELNSALRDAWWSERKVQKLLEMGANPNARGEYGETALQQACLFGGNDRVIQWLLSRGADVHAQGIPLGNALNAACAAGHHRIVRMLVKQGVDVNADIDLNEEDKAKATRAIFFSCTESRRLSSFYIGDIERRLSGDSYGHALQIAAQGNNYYVVRILLATGANVNARGGLHGDALTAAAAHGHTSIVGILLDQGADVHTKGGKHGSPLTAAASKGNAEVVRMLLQHGADVNVPGGKFGSPLMAAATPGHLEVVRILLQNGADVNAEYSSLLDAMGGEDRLIINALQAACGGDSTDVVQLLLQSGAKVNTRGGSFGTALGVAAHFGHAPIVQLLITKGADVNARGGVFGNPLQAAAPFSYGPRDFHWNEDVMFLLLNHGADPHLQEGLYGNALQACCYDHHGLGKERVVRELIRRGVDVNAKGGKFGTAMGAAAEAGNGNVLRLLVENGANFVDEKYHDILQEAYGNGHFGKILRMLEEGSDVNNRGGRYETPLQAASCNEFVALVKLLGGSCGQPLRIADPSAEDQQQIVQLLVAQGAQVNAQGGYYGNALQAASYYGNVNVVRDLILNGASLNARGGFYGNALQAAACHGHEDVVTALLGKGAKAHAHGGLYGTALQAAARHGHISIVERLIRAGARINAGVDRRGTSAVGLYGNALLAAVFHGTEMVELLLSKGANVEGVDDQGRNALHIAAALGNCELIDLLVSYGVNRWGRDLQGRTVLHHAASSGSIKALDYVLATSARTGVCDYDGWTPLQWAARRGIKSVVKRLVQAGEQAGEHGEIAPDLSTNSWTGWTALRVALFHRHLSLALLLAALPTSISSSAPRKVPSTSMSASTSRKSKMPLLDLGTPVRRALMQVAAEVDIDLENSIFVGFQHHGIFCDGCQFVSASVEIPLGSASNKTERRYSVLATAATNAKILTVALSVLIQ